MGVAYTWLTYKITKQSDRLPNPTQPCQIYLRMGILGIIVFMTGLMLNDMASAREKWGEKMDEAIQVFRKLNTLFGVGEVAPVEDKIDEATQHMKKLNDWFVSELETKN